jgi:hypothetical protein
MCFLLVKLNVEIRSWSELEEKDKENSKRLVKLYFRVCSMFVTFSHHCAPRHLQKIGNRCPSIKLISRLFRPDFDPLPFVALPSVTSQRWHFHCFESTQYSL